MRVYLLFAAMWLFGLAVSGQNFTVSLQGRSMIPVCEFDSVIQQKHRTDPFDVPGKLSIKEQEKAISFSMDLPFKTISFVLVGDIMPGTNYPSASYLPRSCSELFRPAYPLIQGADLAIANLEGVFSSDGGTAKNCQDPKTCYVFRMPDAYADCIQETGFDVLGVANNHVNDFGPAGRKNTATLLKEKGFYFAGFRSHPYTIINRKGLEIGFCAFAPHTGTMDLKDYAGMQKIVRLLDDRCDIVIVTFHGGAEGKDHQHIPRENEVYLGYNRGNVYRFAHEAIDAGADMVIGHGPHVVRAMEFYRGKLIAYSLGNFCTYARFNLSGPNALAPALEVWLTENGDFNKAMIHSYYQSGEGGPVPDIQKRAAKRILELSRIDFPEKKIKIDDEGRITNSE